jgi:hypothetical protein
VEADTLRCTARHVRNSLTSAAASAAGSWLRVKVGKGRTHALEAFKVFGAWCRTRMSSAHLVSTAIQDTPVAVVASLAAETG